MTTTSFDPAATPVGRTRDRAAVGAIPMTRILTVELRKMFDTRSGFWLMTSIAIASVLATTAVILFAPDDALVYETFATAVGFPMAVILPLVAILSVTSEWTQRSGLSTFTLVPHRGRVIAAKAICAAGIGVSSMLLAAAVGAVGNVIGAAITGVQATWNVGLGEFALIILANVLGLLVGFTLGLLTRSSTAAIVAYFAYSLLLPTLSGTLASTQQWWRDHRPWLDFNYASSGLFNEPMTSEQWAQLGVSSMIWLLVPLAVGVHLALSSEVN